MTLPWKPVSKEPPFVKGKRPKVFLAGGQFPVGLDFFKDRHEDRTHWLYRHEVPGPKTTARKAVKKATKKVAKKATKKVAKKMRNRK